MKQLANIKYIAFSLIVFGCFANFAQNGYGMLIIKASLVVLATLFFVESIKAKIDKNSTYYLLESLLISLFIVGWIFKMQHWPGAGILLILSGLGLSIHYIKRGIDALRENWKNSPAIAALLALVFWAVSMAFIGYVFKFQHWPGANNMLVINVFLLPLLAIMSFFRYKTKTESIRFSVFVRKLKGNIALLQVIFTVTIVYLGLREVDIAPDFYSLSVPPTLDELRVQKEKGGKEEEVIYQKYVDDYSNFIRRIQERQEGDD